MWQCPKCHELYLSNTDTCICVEFVILDDNGEEETVYAVDAEAAALQYAEDSNVENDYYLMNQTTSIQVLRKDRPPKRYEIGAEPDIHYHVKEVMPCTSSS